MSTYFNKITFSIESSNDADLIKGLIENTGASYYTSLIKPRYYKRGCEEEYWFIVFPKTKEDKILINLALVGQTKHIEQIKDHNKQTKENNPWS